MKYIKILSLLVGVTLLASCVKHEVIPKPKYVSKLPASFKAKINDGTYEIIEDIKGFYSETSQIKEISQNPEPSKVTYYSSFKSTEKLDVVQIRIGKLIFGSNSSETPLLEDFNKFFKEDISSPLIYKAGANNGVEIYFRDSQGKVWMSSEVSGLPQDFELTKLSEDSDHDGDYMKFVARFNVSLYDNLLNAELSDTLLIEDAVFEGYFKR